MRERISRKLRSPAGETLSEVLVALAIIAFSSVLLVSMLTVSGHIDRTVRQKDEVFYQNLTNVELKADGETEAAPGDIVVRAETLGVEVSIPVDLYSEGGLISYQGAGS